MTRGGRREGAGRPPISPEGNRILLTARIHPRTWAMIQSSQQDGESLGRIVDRLLGIVEPTVQEQQLIARATQLRTKLQEAETNRAATMSPSSSTRDGGPAYREYSALARDLHEEYTAICEQLGIVTIADRVRVLGS